MKDVKLDKVDGSDGAGRAWAHYVLAGGLGAVIAFWNLGGAALNDHEAHLALTARTMADRTRSEWLLGGAERYEIVEHTELNHWMVPVENGRPRLVKTPLPYWTAVAASRIGGGVSEWTVRLTSAICAVLLVVVTLWLGRQMFSARAAFFGALMLAGSLAFQRWGRNARPEMILCLLMTLSMACFYRALNCGRRLRFVAWMAAFWVSMGLGCLAKQFVPILLAWPLLAYVFWRRSSETAGPEASLRRLRWFLAATGVGLGVHIAVTFVPALHWWKHTGLISPGMGMYLTMAAALGGPMLWYFFRTRGWTPVLRLAPTAIGGVAVMLAMFVPWMWYMTRLFPDLAGGVFSDQTTDRGAGVGAWSAASPVKYVLGLLTLSLPWSAFLPGAFAVGLMRRFADRGRGLVYLLLWCLGLVVLFSAAAAKREHYLLPMIPALCLLLGFVAEDVFFKHVWIKPNVSRVLAGGYGLTAVVGVAWMAVSWAKEPDNMRHQCMVIVAAVGGVPWAVGAVLAWRGRLRPVLPLLVLGISLVYLGYWTGFPRWDPRRIPADFAREAASIIQQRDPNAEVFHWGDPQAKTVFYFGRQIPGIHWQFLRADPNITGEELGPRVERWIQADRRRARWIFGYQKARGKATEDAEVLPRLGYGVALERQGKQTKRHLFTLWQKGAGPDPVSQPGPGSSDREDSDVH